MTASGADPRPSTQARADRLVRVVVADDQVLFRAGLAVIIGAQPDMVVVGEAGTGREAVAAVDRLAPDVVVMDVQMPDGDGAQATRELFEPIRAATRTQPLRVVVLTTFALEEKALAALRWGASAFLLKDTPPDLLCDAIRTVHAGHAVMAAADLHRLARGAAIAERADSAAPAAVPPPVAFSRLSDKEREVFAAVVRGLSNAEIARELFLGESTVKTHVGSLLRKLALRDRVQVVLYAHEHGLNHQGRS